MMRLLSLLRYRILVQNGLNNLEIVFCVFYGRAWEVELFIGGKINPLKGKNELWIMEALKFIYIEPENPNSIKIIAPKSHGTAI